MKKFAVIDVGTNSVKTTLVEGSRGAPGQILLDENSITRLGEGVDAGKRLLPEAMERSAGVVAELVRKVKTGGAEQVRIVGTSALRDASNRDEFVSLVRDKTGIELEVIAGDREAALAYGAVRADPAVSKKLQGDLLVFDIGGGSTELIVGSSLRPERAVSLDIGAVRLTERCVRTDPPSEEDRNAVLRAASAIIEKEDWIKGANVAAGIGGTVVTIAAVLLSLDPPNPETLNGTVIGIADVEKVLGRLSAVPLAERKSIPGLDPKRADVIIAGGLIVIALLRACGLNAFTVSTRGLRFGLLAEMAAGD